MYSTTGIIKVAYCNYYIWTTYLKSPGLQISRTCTPKEKSNWLKLLTKVTSTYGYVKTYSLYHS